MQTQWRGQAASPGQIVCKAFVITDHNFGSPPFLPFALVTKLTNPRFVSLLLNASGLVTDIGGLSSHAAIIAREMGIPCVVATGSASEHIKTGDLINVDGFDGVVRLIESAQP